jgi:hypothetical protein
MSDVNPRSYVAGASIAADQFAHLTNRGRGLLAHGTGRSAIYELGRRLDARADATEPHGTLNLSGYAAATTSA